MSDAATPTDSRTAGPTTGPRVAPGDRRQVGRLNHAIASALGRAAGTAAPNLFLTLGRHRRLFRGWLHFAGTLMPGGRLSRRESETVILRVANRRGCDYEREHHRRLGLRAGLTVDDVDALGAPDTATDPRWSTRQAAMITAVDQLLEHRDLDDQTWASLRRRLDDRELIELVMLVGHYEMLATAITTLRIQPDGPRTR